MIGCEGWKRVTSKDNEGATIKCFRNIKKVVINKPINNLYSIEPIKSVKTFDKLCL